MQDLNNKERKKKAYAEAAKIYSQRKSFIHEFVMKEKEIHASFFCCMSEIKMLQTQFMVNAYLRQ